MKEIFSLTHFLDPFPEPISWTHFSLSHFLDSFFPWPISLTHFPHSFFPNPFPGQTSLSELVRETTSGTDYFLQLPPICRPRKKNCKKAKTVYTSTKYFCDHYLLNEIIFCFLYIWGIFRRFLVQAKLFLSQYACCVHARGGKEYFLSFNG